MAAAFLCNTSNELTFLFVACFYFGANLGVRRTSSSKIIASLTAVNLLERRTLCPRAVVAPLARGGLDEAFGFAIGAASLWVDEAMADAGRGKRRESDGNDSNKDSKITE